MTRPLLVGEAPGPTGEGPPLGGRAGRLLDRMAGLAFVDACDRVNLLDAWPGHAGKASAFPAAAAREAAAALLAADQHRVLLLAGQRVAAAFGLRRPDYLCWYPLPGGRLAGVIAHPSGVNRWLNVPLHRELTGRFLTQALDLAVAVPLLDNDTNPATVSG